MHALVLVGTIFVVLPGRIGADTTNSLSVGIAASPIVSIPVGPKAEYYGPGYGGQLTGLLAFDAFPWVSPRFDVSYSFIPQPTDTRASLSLVRASAGILSTVRIGERFSLFGYGSVGGYYGSVSGANSADGFFISVHGGGGAAFQLLNRLSIAVGAEFSGYIGTFDALSVFLGVNTRVAGDGGGSVPSATAVPLGPGQLPTTGLVEVSNVQLNTVFPVLWKYYDSNPIGRASLTNIGRYTLSNVEVRVRPARFVDSTKLSATVSFLAPGECVDVDLYILFNDEILSISEGSKVVTDIEVAYRINESEGTDSETVTLESYDRNALQWDDARKIAAFVTAKDEEIHRFARSFATIAEDTRVEAVSPQLQVAMLLYDAIIEQGVAYVVDPSSAYEDLSENPLAVDYVMFPRQTLYVRAGDCDDLSVAFCALLESVGVSTAFITVPGHILAAFKLEWDEPTAIRSVTNQSDLIVREDGSVWIPVETTLLQDGFLAAWEAGARQWRRYSPDNLAEFINTSEAWQDYQPVAFSVSRIELGLPEHDLVRSRYENELRQFVSAEVSQRDRSLRSRLESRPDDLDLLNRLGVLYATYGRYSEARSHFRSALATGDHVPVIVNLANLNLLSGDYRGALQGYEQALEYEPGNAGALVGLVQVQHKLENPEAARAALDQLSRVSADLAERYSRVGSEAATDETERRSEFSNTGVSVIWAQEEE